MRVLFTIFTCLLLTHSFAQKEYRYDYDNTPLSEVIDELSTNYQFKFSYSPKELQKYQVTKKGTATTDADLISEIFQDLPFSIQLTDGVYLVIPKKIASIPLPLTGQIYDRTSGEPLAFAHIQSDRRGTISNQNGRFSLPPREDTLTLMVSYIGYQPIQLKVPPDKNDIQLRLEQDPVLLQEVILNSPELEELSSQTSFFSLNPTRFNALPNLGETDVFKSMQLLPGINATDESSSGLSVRGSLPGQNLILMDGFTLYNLDHFFGIFSTLNPNVINNVSIYKGGFGAEYGGRVSSVIDVAGKKGNAQRFSGGAGVNMLSANGHIQFPIGDKTSILLGVRQSFTEIINSGLYKDFLTSNRKSFIESVNSELVALDLSPSLKFYDLNGKIQHRFSDKSVLDVNVYSSQDNYVGDFIEGDNFASFNIKDEANWSNFGLSLDWKRQVSQKVFSELIVSGSKFTESERLAINQTFFQDASFNQDSIFANTTIDFFDYRVNSSISDFSIKSINEIEIDENNSIKTGAEINIIKTTFNSDQLYFQDFTQSINFNDSLSIQSSTTSLFASHQYETEDFTTNIGVRTSYFGKAQKFYLEPRFNVGFHVSDRFSLKGAASFHHQFVSQNSLSPFQNTDQFYWVLSDNDVIPVQRSTHFILGGNYSVNRWSLDLEYYRKNTSGIIENQFITIPPELIAEARVQNIAFSDIDLSNVNLSGDNISEGIDLFVKYRSDIFSTWLSYSLGFSQNQFWYRNSNTLYPSNQDQRHEVNLTSMVKVGRWEFSAILLFGSGKPFTPPNPEYSIENDSVEIYDLNRINAERLPAYHRFDLAAKYSFPIGKSRCEVGLTLFNLFNRRNIKSRRYTVQYIFGESTGNPNAEDDLRVVALDTPLLGFTPNFFFNIRF